MEKNILTLLDTVRAISQEGLSYAQNPYDVERYKQLMELSFQTYSFVLQTPIESLQQQFVKEFGCITPKVGVDVAILNKDDELLVLQRSDDKTWCVPCGWVNVGDSPLQAAIREVKEETNLDVHPQAYISISTKGPDQYKNITHQVDLTLFAQITSPKNVMLSHEHEQYRWISLDDAMNWYPGHERIPQMIKDYQEGISGSLKLLEE